jgi:uncharacterized protein (TIGR00299 family) protein
MTALFMMKRGSSNMTKIAYFDCFSGCSGDMLLGALLDTGLELDTLKAGLESLDMKGYRLTAEKVRRSSITATKFTVTVDEHAHLYHRPLSDIVKIIESSRLSAEVKQKSCAIFKRLGEVEAKVHGISIEDVRFHELGAIDTIIDIVGTVFALDVLQIVRCYSSPLPVNKGTVSTDHGILPVPAPATLQLLADFNVPVVPLPESTGIQTELLTPTGAVLLTSLASFNQPGMNINRIGYGAGSKEFKEWPNVLRIWLGEATVESDEENMVLLETNIDDMNPQIYGYLMEKLFEQKAIDVWFTPIQMKKNRPAVMLSILAPAQAESGLIELVMRETSTLGIRTKPILRHTARRETVEFTSSLGPVKIKIKHFAGDLLQVAPEYEECKHIAMEKNMPLQEVMRIIRNESHEYLSSSGHLP